MTATSTFTRISFVAGGALSAALSVGGCRAEATPAETVPETPPAVATVAPSGAVSRVSLTTDGGSRSGAAEQAAETPFPGQDPNVGKWVETSAYKFKVTSVRRCTAPTPNAGPPDRPLRVGVTVHVFSKYDQLFVTPRDVALEHDGVVLDSERDAKPGPDCAPALAPVRANHDQTVSGVVIFQVPDEAFVREGRATFHPTRWGGAPRVEIQLREAALALGS